MRLIVSFLLILFCCVAVSAQESEPPLSVTTKGGETIAQIAARYNLPVADVAKWNDLSENTSLPKGATIYLTKVGQVNTQSYRRPQATAKGRCYLRLNEAPPIRGFRLDMPTSEIVNRFEGLKNPKPDEFGVASLAITPRQMELALPLFEGVQNIRFTFMDDKLTGLTVTYDSKQEWKDEQEFLAAVKESLKIEGEWDYDFEDRTTGMLNVIKCDGFALRAALIRKYGDYFTPVIMLDNPSARLTVRDRKVAKAQKESEERKKTFKP